MESNDPTQLPLCVLAAAIVIATEGIHVPTCPVLVNYGVDILVMNYGSVDTMDN